jgi:hypothetical protein
MSDEKLTDKLERQLIPNPEPLHEVFNIGLGDFVKVKVKARDLGDNKPFVAESFWVKIKMIQEYALTSNPPKYITEYSGEVNNDLILDTGYQRGDNIKFTRAYIWNIEKRLHDSCLN